MNTADMYRPKNDPAAKFVVKWISAERGSVSLHYIVEFRGVIFETEDKSITLPVRAENDSVWLNRNQMAELFERDVKLM